MKNRIFQKLKLENTLYLSNKILLSLRLLEQNIMDLEEEILKVVEENSFLELDILRNQNSGTRKVKKAEGTDDAMENAEVRFRTLRDHLIRQIYALDLEEDMEYVLTSLVDLLDSHGFMIIPPEEIAKDLEADSAIVEKALETLRTMDPPGVGCANVHEALKEQTSDPIVLSLIDRLEEIQSNPSKVIRELGITKEEFESALKDLRNLNPYPSNGFDDSPYIEYVEPDIFIIEKNGEYVVETNERFELRFSSMDIYEKLLLSESKEDQQFAKKQYEQAKSLIESLIKRKETLKNIGATFAEKEEEFLRGGKIVPLKISELARELDLSLSTVGRAVSTKFIFTPRGVFPLKAFFSRAVYSSKNGKVSRDGVKKRITEIVAGEDKSKPYSDLDILGILKKEGLSLSRRVIAKYREELMIPSSSRRKTR